MNILIAGGSGFLGHALTDELLKNPNHQVSWLSRQFFIPSNKVAVLSYEQLSEDLVFNVVINLAGAGIADKRWSNERKRELFDSRLKPTEKILDFIQIAKHKPKLLISGSAIGYYGVQAVSDDGRLIETDMPVKPDFASHLCQAWENLANQSPIKTIIIRTGVVLDKKGKGMLKRLLPTFRLGLGGRLGDGKQMMSWIGLEDWVQAVQFIIEQNDIHDLPDRQVYNLTAPDAVNNAQFTEILGKFVRRPTVLALPDWVLRWILGEMATLLLDGQNVYPKALLDLGFKFQHAHLKDVFK